MKYTVYLRTNLVNGKQYVGQTKDFKKRNSDWECLSTKYANKVLTTDRDKYGLENFKTEILAEVETREEAWNLEQNIIKEKNTKYPFGYNMCDGGKTSKGSIFIDETKHNMSQAHIGKKLTDSQKQKISKSLNGKNINSSKLSKQVYQYSLNGELIKIWPSTKECERNGFTKQCIIVCCKGGYFDKRNNKFIKIEQHKGYKWSYKPL